jgi:hypothetical protein
MALDTVKRTMHITIATRNIFASRFMTLLCKLMIAQKGARALPHLI